jgi:hypothetical protein
MTSSSSPAARQVDLAEMKAIERFKLAMFPPLKPVLMLPAPIEDPTTVEIDALRAKLQASPAAAPLFVRRAA